MNNKIIITVIVVAAIVLGGYFLLRSPQSPAPSFNLPTALSQETSQTPLPPTTQVSVAPEASSISQNVVTYTDSGYSPSTLRIKTGTTVTFKNESSRAMWTASAVHPSHTVYSGTALGEHCPDTTGTAFDTCTGIQPGNSWKFTFTKNGTWKYHNHLSPGDAGTIVVE